MELWQRDDHSRAGRSSTDHVRRFQALVEGIPGVIAYMDLVQSDNPAASTPLYISPQVETLLGYERDAWLAEGELWLDVLHPEDAVRMAKADEHARRTLSPLFAEYRMVARGGRIVWVSEKASVVEDAEDGTLYWQGVMVDITDRKQAEAELLHRTFHDPLTELPNRIHFRAAVESAIAEVERGSSLVVLLIDLDRFKEINDTLGHHYGDILLSKFAAALRLKLRSPDLIARLGGDEFAVLLEATDDATTAARSAVARIEELLAEPYVVEGLPLSVEASIGIASFPEDGGDVSELLQHADTAMYVAKRSGSGHAFYEPGEDGKGRQRLQLLAELRRAINERELVLHYQPKLDLRSGCIDRVEALIRWQHPTGGLIPPGEFIPLAEQTGLIHPLTAFVLDAALEQCRLWLDERRDISVAVNISPRSLNEIGFPKAVAQQLHRHDFPAQNLVLEVTESAIIFDPARAEATLNALHQLGVRLALDDFGTGHSSLAFLGRLPLDQIKIDRSFVTDLATNPHNNVIVRSIINLGHQLGLEVVGEGVETSDVKLRLQQYGCDILQGYALTPALPADELERWLERQPPNRLSAAS